MNSDNTSLIILLVGSIAVCAATFYGLAALWAVAGTRGWLWRWAPLALLLAALIPLGAYELLVLYGSQAAIVVIWFAVSGWIRERRATKVRVDNAGLSAPTWTVPQFPMRDMFKALALACAVLAIVRNAAPGTEVPAGTLIDWWRWGIAGAGQGIVTLAAAWAVYSRRRWYFRGAILLIAWAATVAAMNALPPTAGVFGYYSSFSKHVLSETMPFWIPGLQGLATVNCLELLKHARIDSMSLRFGFDATAPLELECLPCGNAALWARTVLLGTGIAGLCALALVYAALLLPTKPVREALPVPNAYDDLLRLAAALDWTAIPLEDSEDANPLACQSFVQDNVKTFALVRSALTKMSRRPYEFTNAFFANNSSIIGFRSLARAFVAEAKAADSAGNYGDASQSYLDILRVADKMSTGGLMVDELIADAFVGVGLDGLARELENLDGAELEAVRQSLETAARCREPFEAVLQREQIWIQLATGWIGRLETFCDHVIRGRQDTHSYRNARNRVVALQQLILAEAAIRRHKLIEGSPPESLAGLVPKFLSALPSDPYSDCPLIYRRVDDGYLLYSVGGNGTDDGGQRVSENDAVTNNIGDLFFDSSTEMSNDSDAMPDDIDDPNGQDMRDAE